MIKSRSYIAIPPGATIREQLEDRGLNQKEFAARMGLSEKHVSRLVNGEVQLTPEVAVRLEMVLGAPARFWSGLEATYREKIAKATAENEMDEDIEIEKKMPYTEMARNGWVEATRDSKEKVSNLRKFFEVARLGLLHNPLVAKIACRRLAVTEKSDYALLAWAQEARREARAKETGLIDLRSLEKALVAIREMTRLEPESFKPRLTELLASCGVAIVFLPHLKGSFLNGATFYEGRKIVIGITAYGKDADRFWFSLFHELGHILLGHVNNREGVSEEDEREADAFARDALIPAEAYSALLVQGRFAREDILRFAENQGIATGIVVGRLQKDGYLKFSSFNDLKTKYTAIA